MFILTSENSIAQEYLIEIRDKEIQLDRMRFRNNMERLGSILAYEMSKSLEYKTVAVESPLGIKEHAVIKKQPVLFCVLRAAIPFYNGFLNFFDKADSGFLGAYRREESSPSNINIAADYFKTPDLNDKEIIIIDPMIATGKSITMAINMIKENYSPSKIHAASLIASKDGIDYLNANADCEIWTVDIDNNLNEFAYIVPGLGDAGDLSFGQKV